MPIGGASSASRLTRSAGELVELGARQLGVIGATSSRLEAQLLLGHATGRSRAALLAHPELSVTTAEERAFLGFLARREAGEPIAYVMGEREFYGRMFRVDRRALIPRPETELLVDLGCAAVARWRTTGLEPIVVDIGTGCGAIAISIRAESGVHVVGTDRSADALALAKENAWSHHVSGSVSLVQTDLVGGLRGPLHLILANLPYVPRDRDLPREVKDYEPALAIFGGARGTELIERLLREARPLLAPGAEVCVELDEEEQAEPMAALARGLYLDAVVSVHQDLGGYDRVVRVHLSRA
ncbi:MAG: peptide chain release factor N(5)-glutamine methyltransferase [Chloroflexota bacterium]